MVAQEAGLIQSYQQRDSDPALAQVWDTTVGPASAATKLPRETKCTHSSTRAKEPQPGQRVYQASM